MSDMEDLVGGMNPNKKGSAGKKKAREKKVKVPKVRVPRQSGGGLAAKLDSAMHWAPPPVLAIAIGALAAGVTYKMFPGDTTALAFFGGVGVIVGVAIGLVVRREY